MEHIRFIKKPSLQFYAGIQVNEDTKFEMQNEFLHQTLENLVLTTTKVVSGDGYDATYKSTVYLEAGDILIHNGDDHGYVKPVESFCTIADAINEFELVKDLR